MRYIRRRGIKRRLEPVRKKGSILSPLHMSGVYKMYSNSSGEFKQIDEKHNILMDTVFNQVALCFDELVGLSRNYHFDYMAIGDDNTTPTSTDTQLGNEVYRVPYISRANPSNGVITADYYITDSEFSGDIEELGMMGGQSASATANSGNMISHVLWSYTKTSAEELFIEYELTVSD